MKKTELNQKQKKLHKYPLMRPLLLLKSKVELTDKNVNEIDKILENKEKEIMSI